MDYKKILEETDALIHGHFLLSSGLHSDLTYNVQRRLDSHGMPKNWVTEFLLKFPLTTQTV